MEILHDHHQDHLHELCPRLLDDGRSVTLEQFPHSGQISGRPEVFVTLVARNLPAEVIIVIVKTISNPPSLPVQHLGTLAGIALAP